MGRRGRDKIFAPQRHARYIGSYRREDVSMLSPFRLPPHGAAKRPAERSRAATQRAMGYFPLCRQGQTRRRPRRTPRTRLMAACLAAERKWSFRTLFICGVLVMTG